MAKSFSDLSEDTVFDILVRLPVKSLLRLKSVSKAWLRNISNPHFVKSHLAQQKPTLLAIADAPFNPNCLDPSAAPVNFRFLEIPSLFFHCQVVSSFNGIVCVANCRRAHIFLWNPSIKHYKRVLVPGRSPELSYHYSLTMDYISIGFGYDHICNDYKVLLFVYHTSGFRYSRTDTPSAVKVYSTNSDSWRDIGVPVHIKLPNSWFDMCMICGPVINGLFYFESRYGIVSFDWHNEVFDQAPYPSFKREKRSNVFDFRGSVAMICKVVSDVTINLWTLDDVSGEVSWTKKFNFAAHLDINGVFLYVGAGKFYGRGDKWNRLMLYDSEKNETTYFQLPAEDIPPCVGYTANHPATGSLSPVLKYTDTLVSVEGFEPVDPFTE